MSMIGHLSWLLHCRLMGVLNRPTRTIPPTNTGHSNDGRIVRCLSFERRVVNMLPLFTPFQHAFTGQDDGQIDEQISILYVHANMNQIVDQHHHTPERDHQILGDGHLDQLAHTLHGFHLLTDKGLLATDARLLALSQVVAYEHLILVHGHQWLERLIGLVLNDHSDGHHIARDVTSTLHRGANLDRARQRVHRLFQYFTDEKLLEDKQQKGTISFQVKY